MTLDDLSAQDLSRLRTWLWRLRHAIRGAYEPMGRSRYYMDHVYEQRRARDRKLRQRKKAA